MSFMFRDRKETDFAYDNSPEPLYTKSELESEISVLESIIADDERKLALLRKELGLYRVALIQKFYKVV